MNAIEYKRIKDYITVAKIEHECTVFWRYRNFGVTQDFNIKMFPSIEAFKNTFTSKSKDVIL